MDTVELCELCHEKDRESALVLVGKTDKGGEVFACPFCDGGVVGLATKE